MNIFNLTCYFVNQCTKFLSNINVKCSLCNTFYFVLHSIAKILDKMFLYVLQFVKFLSSKA